MGKSDADEIVALRRMLTYARQEAERLELWRVWDQLRFTERLLAEQTGEPGFPGKGCKTTSTH